MLLPRSLSGARLLALGASGCLHLAGILVLPGFLNTATRDTGRRDHMTSIVTLTIVSPKLPPVSAPAAKAVHSQSFSEPAGAIAATTPVAAEAPERPLPVAETPKPVAPPLAQADVPTVVESNEDDRALILREYQLALWRRIDAFRPRGVGASGTVLLRFQLTLDGAISSAIVAKTSGNIILDKIALRTLRQAVPLPPPPPDTPSSMLLFEIPISFH